MKKKIDWSKPYAQHFGSKAKFEQDGIDFDNNGLSLQDFPEEEEITVEQVVAEAEVAHEEFQQKKKPHWMAIRKAYDKEFGHGEFKKLPKGEMQDIALKALAERGIDL